MLLPMTWIICRVCLKQQEEMLNIFEDRIHENVWALLRDCGGVPVRKNDNFPNNICEACLRNLWKAYKFRIDCQRSHRELVQKQMEKNYLMHEQENIGFSNISTHQTKLNMEPEIPNLNEKKDKTTNENESVDNESSKNIKAYCIDKKNDNEERNLKTINKSPAKQPIVLLLKVNHDDRNTERSLSESEPKTIKLITSKKALIKIPKRSNKTKSGKLDNVQLKNITLDRKSKTIAKNKINSKSEKRKSHTKRRRTSATNVIKLVNS